MEIFKEPAPAIWASYIVNCDNSGLDDSDIAQCDDWCAEFYKEGYQITLENNEESYFGVFEGLGHDLVDYTIYKP